MYRDRVESCPRCGDPLRDVSVGQRRWQRCPGCRGAWLEGSTFASMWAEASGGQPVPSTGRELAEGARRLACPSCARTLEPARVLRVPIDVCVEHGVWFDTEELGISLAGAQLPESDWVDFFAEELRRLT